MGGRSQRPGYARCAMPRCMAEVRLEERTRVGLQSAGLDVPACVTHRPYLELGARVSGAALRSAGAAFIEAKIPDAPKWWATVGRLYRAAREEE